MHCSATLAVLVFLAARISECSAFCRSPSFLIYNNARSSAKIFATERSHSRLFVNVEDSLGQLSPEKLATGPPITEKDDVRSWLICGDGDLSFSASIASEAAEHGINLVATVLEDKESHQNVYQSSDKHQNSISSWHSHSVFFGVDATDLSSSFNDTKFDRIQFNFPHWRGKSNIKRNRELLDQFLKSASGSLSENGEIHVALCQGQGGATADTLEGWRQSWMAAEYGGKNGLLLRNVIPFQPHYDLSSHRGVDRGFKVGDLPKLYIFDAQNGHPVPEQYQLCCRHELHIELPPDSVETPPFSRHDITDGDAILSLIESILPNGIRVEIPARKVLEPSESGVEMSIVIFLIVYCAEAKPLTREEADRYRADAEDVVAKHIPLRANRAGRLVSRPFPYPLLDELLAGQVRRSLGNAR